MTHRPLGVHQTRQSRAVYITLLGEEKPNCVYQNSLQFSINSLYWFQAVVCVSTPMINCKAGTFLFYLKNTQRTVNGYRFQPETYVHRWRCCMLIRTSSIKECRFFYNLLLFVTKEFPPQYGQTFWGTMPRFFFWQAWPRFDPTSYKAVTPLAWVPWVSRNPSKSEEWVLEPINIEPEKP